MKIAIHGAEGTGKEALAAALARALDQRGGYQVCIEVSPSLDSPDIALTFVCGLDWTDDRAPSPCSGTRRESEDSHLREALTAAGINFQVVYGLTDVRVANAQRAIDTATGTISSEAPITYPQWKWSCDKCSDSSCEHRLFSELVR
jgi:CO dehydrogenase nickel-insertion accessory protein CooC1